MNPHDQSQEIESYQLSPEENERIFRRVIVPIELDPVAVQEQPIAVILLGQPGAGKSATADQVRDVFGTDGFVEVDSDLYKPYHPRYEQVLRLDDKLMAAAIGPDGRAWMAKVQDYVRAHRLNALVHEIAEDPDRVIATARSYKDAGYQVALLVLAVPEGISRQGILDRYFTQVEDRGVGRLSVPEKAALSYARIPECAARLEGELLADAVAVFRRGFNPAGASSSNERGTSGEWVRPPAIAAAIHAERDRVTPQELADFTARQDKLRAVGIPQFSAEIATIESLVAALSHDSAGPSAHPANRAARVFSVQVADVVRNAALVAPGAAAATVESDRQRRDQTPRGRSR